MASKLQWNDLKLLLSAERASSLNELAGALGMDPTTASRKMKALEGSVGVSLFIRSHGALRLTGEGKQLLVHARTMEDVEHSFKTSVEKLMQTPEGKVRINVSSTLNGALIAPHITELREVAPRILIELNADLGNVRLEEWEADIALRLGTLRDVNDTLVARKLGILQYAVFEPAEITQVVGWISYSEHFSHLPEAAYVQEALGGNSPIFRSNDLLTMANAVASGSLRAVLPIYLGASVHGIVQSSGPVIERDIWALRRREMGQTSAVRTTYEWIANLFKMHC